MTNRCMGTRRWIAGLVAAAIALWMTAPSQAGQSPSDTPQCTASGVRPASNQPATVQIDSRCVWRHTGVQVEQGVTYELRASGTWVDKTYSSGPDGYDSPNTFMKLAEVGKRVRSAKWFALIGALDEDDKTMFVIGSQATFSPTRSGELVAFANDWKSKYGNNHGEVTLTITRK